MIFTLSRPQSTDMLLLKNQRGTHGQATNSAAIVRAEAKRLAIELGRPIIVRGNGEILAYVTPRTDGPLPYVVWNFTIPLSKSRKPLGFDAKGAREEKVNV